MNCMSSIRRGKAGDERARARIPRRDLVVREHAVLDERVRVGELALLRGRDDVEQLAQAAGRRDVLGQAVAGDVAEGARAERGEERRVRRTGGRGNRREAAAREVDREHARRAADAAERRRAVGLQQQHRADHAEDRDAHAAVAVDVGDRGRARRAGSDGRQHARREQRHLHRPAGAGTVRSRPSLPSGFTA